MPSFIRRVFNVVLGTVVLLVTWPSRTEANLRAPREMPRPSSTALSPASDNQNLSVLGETLRFHCQPELCEVSATYLIRALSPRDARLEFILPIQGTVRVRLGGRAFKVPTAPAGPVPERERIRWMHDPPPLYRASFQVSFTEGRNELTVEYVQLIGEREEGHSYLFDGDMVKEWSYELWPLGEWRRDRNMSITVEVDVPRRPPGLWQRMFDTYENVSCSVLWADEKTERPPVRSTEQRGPRLHHSLRIVGVPSVPQRLFCRWGPVQRVYDG